MSQFDPPPGSDEELPLEQEPSLLDEHDAELNYVNALLWVSLTNSMPSHETATEYVMQGEKQCTEIIRARGLESKTAFGHFCGRSSVEKNG
jgi:hypothetical protein